MSGILTSFFGLNANGRVSVSNRTIIASTLTPTASQSTLQLTNTGVLNTITTDAGTVAITNEWLIGSNNGAAYEAFVTVTAGTLTSGTTGAWVSLGATTSWSKTQSAIGSGVVTFTLQIRDVATQTVQTTATITLQSDVSA